MLENNQKKTRKTQKYPKIPDIPEIPAIPGNTRKKKRYPEIPDRIFRLSYPTRPRPATRYFVQYPTWPDPILKNPSRWALTATHFVSSSFICWSQRAIVVIVYMEIGLSSYLTLNEDFSFNQWDNLIFQPHTKSSPIHQPNPLGAWQEL